jgi:hypothetical protein
MKEGSSGPASPAVARRGLWATWRARHFISVITKDLRLNGSTRGHLVGSERIKAAVALRHLSHWPYHKTRWRHGL